MARARALHRTNPHDDRQVAEWDPGEVHLWSCATAITGPAASRLELLDDVERARADRFAFEADRNRYVQRRAFARTILGHYLGIDPAALGLGTSALGKPEISRSHGISFNTSSSGDMAVIAVSRGRPVGVDIERMRELTDPLELAAGFFAAPEIELVRSTPPHCRSRVFLELWTRKESVVKAIGGGLHIPLDRFLVLAQGRVPFDAAPKAMSPLALARLGHLPGYVGAVSLKGTNVTIRHMQLSVDWTRRG